MVIVSATWNVEHTIIKVLLDDDTILWVPNEMENCDRWELAVWDDGGGTIEEPEE